MNTGYNFTQDATIQELIEAVEILKNRFGEQHAITENALLYWAKTSIAYLKESIEEFNADEGDTSQLLKIYNDMQNINKPELTPSL